MSKFVGGEAEVLAERQAVIAAAMEWLGTPFHHRAGVKGVGVDCLHLVWRVAQARGYIPADREPPPYKPQWFIHRGERLFIKGLIDNGAERVDVGLPGDIAMYDFGRHAAHASIIVDGNRMIHAFMPVGRVTIADRREFLPKLDSYWSVFPQGSP